MAGSSEKRNSRLRLVRSEASVTIDQGRVGGRQAAAPLPGGGGGYLFNCTASNFDVATHVDRDPRLDDLRVMGLPAVWMRVAETIGFDAFLATWRILDADTVSYSERPAMLQPLLRPFRSYLRFQRNRYIEALCGRGLTMRAIQGEIQRQLCERISVRHILRIASRR